MTSDVPMTAMPTRCDIDTASIHLAVLDSEQAVSANVTPQTGAAIRVTLVQSAFCFLACLVWYCRYVQESRARLTCEHSG